MLSEIERATQKKCLVCKRAYTPEKNTRPEEYPYCEECNWKETQRLRKLKSSATLCSDDYKVRPGKRAGIKTMLRVERLRKEKQARRIKKTVYFVNDKGGIYENNFTAF